ncbi:tetraspanin 68C isoform X2 [Leptinotarsa decemlineata]
MLVLFDNERVLLSKLLSTGQLSNLPHPLLHYISIGVALLGVLLAATGILGCWASCLHNYYLLTLYFLIIMIVLVGECAIYVVAWVWPSCMGLGLEVDDLIKALQKNYGISGQEQFTVAVDLAQTTFNCCGIDSANEYDTSLWRLQGFGPSLAVPLSCCKLMNANQSKAYLNPEPVSPTLCQALERNRHEGFRHLTGCSNSLEQWYRDHYITFLGVGLVIVLVEFGVLLTTILTCTRLYHHNQEIKENHMNTQQEPESPPSTRETSFRRPTDSDVGAYSNETYALPGNFKHNYKLMNRA